jgi:tetratricopeptide (TPR) repeat protein
MSEQSNIKQLLLRARLQIEEGQHQLALILLEGIHSDDPKEQNEIDYLLGWCHTLNRSWKEAQNVLTQVVKMSESEDGIEYEDAIDRERRALCYFKLGKAALQLNCYEEAIRHYNKCFKLLSHPKISRAREQVECLYGIGTSHLMRGLFASAIQWYKNAREFCNPLENEKELANIYYGLCQAYRRSGKLGEALHFGEKALYLYEKNAMQILEGRMHNELGHIARQLGNFRVASDHFTDSLALAINYNTPKMVMINNAALAEVRLAEERFEDARRCCQRALEVIGSVDDAGVSGWTYLTFGQVAQKEAEGKDGTQKQQLLEEAVEWFKQSDEKFALTDDEDGKAKLYRHWGNALEDLGQAEEAIRCWRRGYEALSSATGPTWD